MKTPKDINLSFRSVEDGDTGGVNLSFRSVEDGDTGGCQSIFLDHLKIKH